MAHSNTDQVLRTTQDAVDFARLFAEKYSYYEVSASECEEHAKSWFAMVDGAEEATSKALGWFLADRFCIE